MTTFKKFRNSNLFAIKDSFMPYRKYFIGGAVFIILSGITQVTLPYLFGILIDKATQKTITGILSNLNYIAITIFIVFLMNSLFNVIKKYFFHIFAEKTCIKIMNQLFRKFVRLPMKFYDQNLVGELFSRINTDIALIKNVFSEQIVSCFYQPLIMIFCFINLFTINYKLAFLLTLVFPPAIYFSLKLAVRVKKLAIESLNLFASGNVILQEDLQLIRVIKTFNTEYLEEIKYSNVLDKVLKKSVATAITKLAIEGLASFVLLLGIMLIIWYASILVLSNTITAGRLIEFIVNTVFIGNAYSAINIAIGTIQKSSGATERIKNLLNETVEDITLFNDNQKIIFNKNISFNNIVFSYPARESILVLSGADLKINKGEKIGIIGESGGGKSTVLQLLLRFYNPSSGKITIDGININNIPLSNYRRVFGVVSQDIKLFSGTIADNIKYGFPNATEYEILAACKVSNSYDFIMNLPNGFNTYIGENGTTLSGGQRQRIAIARAILLNPEVLILDEATSAIDNESESIINELMLEFMADKTVIIISHKLSVIKKMDKIFKIENGKIIELKDNNTI
jgi:ABC-type multidrug transport system fused ATPase/permease subunit